MLDTYITSYSLLGQNKNIGKLSQFNPCLPLPDKPSESTVPKSVRTITKLGFVFVAFFLLAKVIKLYFPDASLEQFNEFIKFVYSIL